MEHGVRRGIDPGWAAFGIALAAVALARAWVVHELPVAVFSSDSHTYLRTARMFWFENWHIGVHAKRSFLYPVLLTLLHPLPGGLAFQVPWLQQALTLLVPWFAVRLLREWTPSWRWLAAPLALALGLSAPFVYYANYMLADALYATACWFFLWRLWRHLRAPSWRRAAWAAGAALLATSLRPDGKLLALLGLAASALGGWLGAGRPGPSACSASLRGHAWAAVAVLALTAAATAVGARPSQTGWLMYSRFFPLTRLDTPRHAELKAELRPFVEELRRDLSKYPAEQDWVQHMLGHRSGRSVGPKWDELRSGGQDPRLHNVCRDLAREGILADPWGAAQLAFWQYVRVLRLERNMWEKFRPRSVLGGYDKELAKEPGYEAMLFGARTLDEVAAGPLRGGAEASALSEAVRLAGGWLDIPWWGPAAACALAGWLLAVWRWRAAMLLWLSVPALAFMATFCVGRAITRYLLPFEPLLPLGIAAGLGLLFDAAPRLCAFLRRRG